MKGILLPNRILTYNVRVAQFYGSLLFFQFPNVFMWSYELDRLN